MSLIPSADARAVVAAVDRLSTQLRRLLDGVSTPLVGDPFPAGTCDASTLGVDDRHLGPCLLRLGHDGPVHRGPEGETWATVVATADDAPTTTADDGPTPDFTSLIAGRIEVRQPCPYCGDQQMIPRHQFNEHVARLHPDVRTGGPGIPVPLAEGPVADEDAERTARRVSLRVLINRVNHGLVLTVDEAQLLARHVATEICDANEGRKRAAQAEEVRAELEQAQAAINRVRALRDPIAEAIEQADYSGNMRRGDLADSVMPVILAALDGTDQPTGCSCHNLDEWCSGCRRCPDICHGCDG